MMILFPKHLFEMYTGVLYDLPGFLEMGCSHVQDPGIENPEPFRDFTGPEINPALSYHTHILLEGKSVPG
jgi:hypothetical protein